MRLSTKTRYAVRALFDIAYHGGGRATQARDIARRQEVPLRYLEQIFQELKRAKLVVAKRGPRGGYALRLTPEEMTLGDVVRAMQGPLEPLLGDGDEPATGEAGRGGGARMPGVIWRDLGQRLSACFDEVSFRDLCQRGEALGVLRGEAGHMYFI